VSKSNLVTDAAAEFKGRATNKQKVQALLHKYPWVSSAVVLVFALFIFSFGNENFLTPNNLSLILQQTAVIGAIAAGQTLIILTAGIDLSCGASQSLLQWLWLKLHLLMAGQHGLHLCLESQLELELARLTVG